MKQSAERGGRCAKDKVLYIILSLLIIYAGVITSGH